MNTTTVNRRSIDLRALLDLQQAVEAMGLRLLAGERVGDDEYRELSTRADRAGRAFVAALVGSFAHGMIEGSERRRVSDSLIMVADRISGMWTLGALWDDVNADRQTHALTMRLLDAKRREGAPMSALWDLYDECEPDLTDEARHDVTSWLRSLEG